MRSVEPFGGPVLLSGFTSAIGASTIQDLWVTCRERVCCLIIGCTTDLQWLNLKRTATMHPNPEMRQPWLKLCTPRSGSQRHVKPALRSLPVSHASRLGPNIIPVLSQAHHSPARRLPTSRSTHITFATWKAEMLSSLLVSEEVRTSLSRSMSWCILVYLTEVSCSGIGKAIVETYLLRPNNIIVGSVGDATTPKNVERRTQGPPDRRRLPSAFGLHQEQLLH